MRKTIVVSILLFIMLGVLAFLYFSFLKKPAVQQTVLNRRLPKYAHLHLPKDKLPKTASDINQTVRTMPNPSLTHVDLLLDAHTLTGGVINEVKLREMLNDFNFWNEKGVILWTLKKDSMGQMIPQLSSYSTVRYLIVHITDEVQKLDPHYRSMTDLDPYQSFGMKYDNRKLTLHIYLYVNRTWSENSKDLSGMYSDELFSAIWFITHPPTSNNKPLEELSGKEYYYSDILNMKDELLLTVN